jgi:hypothetical protein
MVSFGSSFPLRSGQDHPHTLATRHWLGRWRGEAGDPQGGINAFESLLADRLRVLGSNHPNTIATQQGLDDWRGKANVGSDNNSIE